MTLRAIIWCAVSSRAQAADDKTSLLQQEASARELCQREGWQIVDVLRVPGHTRSYVDYYEMAEDAARTGIPAFYQLRDHWRAKDFDVLICRDGDRFAREQAPVALLIGKVIEAGARIYSMDSGGWIDAENHRIQTIVIGYKASTEIDQLRKKQGASKDARARLGLPTNGRSSFAHKVVRNDFGKALNMVLDESRRQLFEDVATLVLEGVSWVHIEKQLYERFGHIDPRTGKPFTRYFFYHLLHNPFTWGHGARHFKGEFTANKQKTAHWAYDDSVPVPPGVLIERNVVPPVFTGERASALVAELRRRRALMGGGRPNRAHKFTGLLLCGHCGFYMVNSGGRRGIHWYRCRSRYTARTRPGCQVGRTIREAVVVEWLDNKFREMAACQQPDLLARQADMVPASTIDNVRAELAEVERVIAGLIRRQATAPEDVADLYSEQIRAGASRRGIVRARLAELEQQVSDQDTSDAAGGFEEYLAMGSANFWKQDDATINRILHRIMGRRRLVVLDGDIEHTADAPPVTQQNHGPRHKRKLR